MPRAKKKAKSKPQYTKEKIITLQRRALQLYKADESHAIELGFALLEVKKALKGSGKGAFEKWWIANKLSQARVSYCMRAAQGKVAAAKTKRRSPFKGAYASVVVRTKKEVDDLFRAYVEPQPQTEEAVDKVYQRLTPVIGDMILTIGRIQNWDVKRLHSLEVERQNKSMSTALHGLIRAMFLKDKEHAPEQANAAGAGV